MVEPDNISTYEFEEIDNEMSKFIGGEESYGFDGDVDELPSFADPSQYELLDDSFSDIDFSQIQGDYKKINRVVSNRTPKQRIIKKVIVPNERKIIIEGGTKQVKRNKMVKFPMPKPSRRMENTPIQVENGIGIEKSTTLINPNGKNPVQRVLIPKDRKVIVEGISDFIVSDSDENDAIRNIGYYQGEKLQQLVLIFNNDSPNEFNLELFNPSMPLDYLYSTSQNLNSRIQVAGGEVSYSDVLFNILANPIMCPSATVTISGAQATQQQAVPFLVTNKFVNGVTKINPVNIALQIDNMQVEGNNISFNFQSVLNKCYIPDGMEIITYKILAGNTVTVCFYYKQYSIKKLFYEEARKAPKMI